MRIGRTVTLLLIILYSFSGRASNDFIVKLKASAKVNQLDAHFKAGGMFKVQEMLSGSLGLFLVRGHMLLDQKSALVLLKDDENLAYVQVDHKVSPRASDPLLARQWGLSSTYGINAPQAWQYTTGGQTLDGNPVAVGIVDGGMDLAHEDLVGNVWTNQSEVAGNHIDDDGNGFVDDVNGWNAYDDNGEVPSHYHGTHVAGIVGAQGNNGKGVSGVNWNVGLIPVAGSSGQTSVVIKAYDYLLTLKKRFLATGGEQGALVVAINSSFGIDYAKCDQNDYPVWNDMFDTLGENGILSIAATINDDVNVDEDGDVPTACSSPYVVAVTNTTVDGVKYRRAGYGSTSIDLGAPGTSILSTVPGNNYGEATGTSMATPQVTGAVALAYSVLSSDQIITRPSETALLVKEALLGTVTPQEDLNGRTVSGGRLNLEKFISRLR